MIGAPPFICDGCGAVKGFTNHWWWARQGGPRDGKPGSYFVVGPFDGHSENDKESEHFCGQKCVVKRFSQFLTEKQDIPQVMPLDIHPRIEWE